MTLPYDDPQAFSASTWRKQDQSAALIDRHTAAEFEIVDLGQGD